MKQRLGLGLLFATLLIAGCSGPLVKVAPAPPAAYETTHQAEGGACGALLFGIVPIGVNSRLERAYKQAVHRAGAIGLTDTAVTDRWYWIYIGELLCTDVRGTGFREVSAAAAVH